MNAIETEVFEKLRKRLNLSHVDAATVAGDTSLFEGGLDLDSIDILEIAAMVQKDYGITIAATDRNKDVFGTVGTLAAFIEKNRK
ncbi:MAG TPA: phosphopantetheine-binding protein [Myxococcales bacterium]|jgi:acyl carrier protein